MSFWTKARDAVENTAAIATDPFTAGQSGRLVSKSGQDSSLGKATNLYGKAELGANIIGGAVGGAMLLPGVAGGTAAAPAAESAPFYSGADAEAFGAGISPETGEAMDLGAEPLGEAGGAGVTPESAVASTAGVPVAGPGATGTAGATGATSAAAGGNAITRYGPLALGTAGLASNILTGQRSARRIGQIGQAQRDAGNQLLAQYNSGQLTVSDAHNIAAYEASATAAAKQYFAKSGQSDSTAANATLSTIQGNVAAMKDQAVQNYLKLGTSMLTITDQYQLEAIQAGMKNDQQMWQMIFNFGNTYGQWNRSLNTMTA